jgi:CheY-like chemotaxis protein
VIINLLSNAIKYNRADGTVVVECAVTSRRVRISISDTGTGLSPEMLSQLFQSFNRLGREATSEEGTGIGLVMSKRLVELMGGAIGVESTVGSGSRFWFDLNSAVAPCLTAGPAESTVVAQAKVRDGQPIRTLLYIEDNPENLKLVEQLIVRRPDMRLLSAGDGNTGIQLARANHPDLILIDINLPGISGIEVLRRLREDPATMHIPLVALSANAMPRDISQGMLAGFVRYLTKPIKIDEFMNTLDVALELGLKPARILVADDSPDNCLLIQSYLRGSPYQLTFEENGKAAVDRFATSAFDLILMDVQMPVMDGIAATRAIRELERARGNTPTPILAVTANSSMHDTERTASAGCNAHLSKPISKLELLSAIEKFRLRPLKPVEEIKPERLEPIRIEMPCGLENIVPLYLSTRINEVPEMIDLLAKADYARLAILGHNLKGTGGAYGFPELSRWGATLEQSAKHEDAESLRTQMTELGIYLGQVQLFGAL